MTETKGRTAAEELERAEQEAREILERVRAGDKRTGPEDLEAAERRVRFARARLEGEERRNAEEAERERLGRIEEIGKRAASELDPEPLRKLGQKAERALSAYVGACVTRNVRLEEIASELEALAPLPRGVVVDRSRSAGARISAGGREASPVRPVAEVSSMAHAALREHIPRGFIDLESPSD
jgi:hypothetical protein